jgi:hypothetical protein
LGDIADGIINVCLECVNEWYHLPWLARGTRFRHNFCHRQLVPVNHTVTNSTWFPWCIEIPWLARGTYLYWCDQFGIKPLDFAIEFFILAFNDFGFTFSLFCVETGNQEVLPLNTTFQLPDFTVGSLDLTFDFALFGLQFPVNITN